MLRPALCASLVMFALSACSGAPRSAAPAQSGPAPGEADPAPAPADATAAAPSAAPSEQEHDDGFFANPKLGEQSAPPPPSQVQPGMLDPALIARVKRRFGEACRPERSCGGLLGVDCNAAVDGPYYYVAQADLEVVSTCGGACRLGCTDCPPKAWTCAVN